MTAPTPGWRYHPLLANRRVEFLDTPIHLVTMAETLELATEAMTRRRPLHHTVVNVSKLVNMRRSDELYEDVVSADLINVDGAGVLFGARLFGIEVPERVAGVDIMERLFAICAERGFRPFLLGAEQDVLNRVAERLQQDHPSLKLAGMQHGYFAPAWEGELVAQINASGADCLFVAMPTPRKERFLKQYRDLLATSFVMGVGGSFDVYGGKVKRAPKLIQKLGLEWAYRVMQEPGRLWQRYWDSNVAFAGLMLRELVRRR